MGQDFGVAFFCHARAWVTMCCSENSLERECETSGCEEPAGQNSLYVQFTLGGP